MTWCTWYFRFMEPFPKNWELAHTYQMDARIYYSISQQENHTHWVTLLHIVWTRQFLPLPCTTTLTLSFLQLTNLLPWRLHSKPLTQLLTFHLSCCRGLHTTSTENTQDSCFQLPSQVQARSTWFGRWCIIYLQQHSINRSMNSNHSTSCCHLCEMPQALATNSKSCTQMPYQQKYLSRALCGAPRSDKDILTEPKSADTYIIESHTILVPPSTTWALH